MIPNFSKLRTLGVPHRSHPSERLTIDPEDPRMRSRIAEFLKSNPNGNIYLIEKHGRIELHVRDSFGEHAPRTRLRKLIFGTDTQSTSRRAAIDLLAEYGFKCDLDDKDALNGSLEEFERLNTLWVSNDLEFKWDPESRIGSTSTGDKSIHLAERNSTPAYDEIPEFAVIKLLEDTQASAREIESTEALCNCRSTHLIKYIAHGYVGNDLALAMEYGGASDIHKTANLLRSDASEQADGSPPIISKHAAFTIQLYFLKQVLRGLAAIHEEGYVHHDVKPDNCFMTEAGFVKLGDFSISQKIGIDIGEKLTDAHLYHSPEVVAGQLGIRRTAPLSAPPTYVASPALDIWSIGMVLYEMATDENPFSVKDGPDFLQALKVKDFQGALSLPKGTGLSEKVKKHVNDFLAKTVNSDPTKRASTAELLGHPLLRGVEKEGGKLYAQWVKARTPAKTPSGS